MKKTMWFVVGVLAVSLGLYGLKTINGSRSSSQTEEVAVAEEAAEPGFDVAEEEAKVIAALQKMDYVINIAAVYPDHDPNGGLAKSDSYVSAVYFSSEWNTFQDLEGDELITRGIDAGGCIEMFRNEKDAWARHDHIDDLRIFGQGYRKYKNLLIRTPATVRGDARTQLEEDFIKAYDDVCASW